MDKTIVIQNSSHELLRLRPDEIIYIKSDGNYSDMWLYGRDKAVEIWDSLADLSKLLDDEMRDVYPVFVRTGKQHILNIDYIHRIDTKNDTLTLWRKGMGEPIILRGLSHKALQNLSTGIVEEKEKEKKRKR